jgi:hypothetical protein
MTPDELREAMTHARIAAASVHPYSHNSALILDGERDGTDIVQSALAAILAMQPHIAAEILAAEANERARIKRILLAIISAALAAYLTYLGTARLNQVTAVQQQRMVAVQQFEESGARLDSSMSIFVDALLDGQDLKDARRDVRVALTIHASQADALRGFAGKGNVDRYLEALKNLRRLTDATTNLPTAKMAAQEHVNVMDFRVRFLKQLKHNVYAT